MNKALWLSLFATFVCAFLAGCADSTGASSQSIAADRGLSAEWVVGGGSDSVASSAQDLRVESTLAGPSDNAQPRVVADDGALWLVRRGDVGRCASHPRMAYSDGVIRIAEDGSVTDVDLGFIDPMHLGGARSGDCPVVIAGPVSARDGSVILTVSSQIDDTNKRGWWRTYRVSPDGEVELWEPQLPDGYTVVGLGRSAGPEVLVVGGWQPASDESPALHQLFAVDPQTMAVRRIGLPDGAVGYRSPADPGSIWMDGGYPPDGYSLALLADGCLAFWSDSYDASKGLWVEGNDGLMVRLIDASDGATPSGEITAGGPGESLGTVSSLAGSQGWRLEPSPDGRLLLEMWNPKFADLYSDTFHVSVKGAPSGSAAQEIVDGSFKAVDGARKPQGVNAPSAVVVLGAEALAGADNAPFAAVTVGRSTHCVWGTDGSVICGTPRDAESGDEIWMDWAYYRVPESMLNETR